MLLFWVPVNQPFSCILFQNTPLFLYSLPTFTQETNSCGSQHRQTSWAVQILFHFLSFFFLVLLVIIFSKYFQPSENLGIPQAFRLLPLMPECCFSPTQSLLNTAVRGSCWYHYCCCCCCFYCQYYCVASSLYLCNNSAHTEYFIFWQEAILINSLTSHCILRFDSYPLFLLNSAFRPNSNNKISLFVSNQNITLFGSN